MYDLKVVKRKKTRKIVAAAAGVATAALVIICAIAFLGRYSGAFTVSLKSGAVKTIGLAETYDSDSYEVYMSAGDVKPFDEFTYTAFSGKYQGDFLSQVDAEYSNFDGKNSSNGDETVTFFKYTFYVVNYGDEASKYSLSLNMSSSDKGKTSLANCLRVGFFENKVVYDENDNYVEALQTHDCTYYAQGATEPDTRYDESTDPSHNHPIEEYRSRLYYGGQESGSDTVWCEKFERTNTLLTSTQTEFGAGEIMRYTFLFWIEGTDPECSGKAPLENRLKLWVSINVG